MGRMIDPYLIRGIDGLWRCFYKQNGASFSTSPDLKTWTFAGRADAGENVCVLPDKDGGWLMFHERGIGMASMTCEISSGRGFRRLLPMCTLSSL